jgi:hypothetical protein
VKLIEAAGGDDNALWRYDDESLGTDRRCTLARYGILQFD